ncbi:hypothetical protein ACFY0G_12120 [Streptomyces sp. NPDC001552]|uniref:hypothetical protein n=1 Tax=Streptomyces sp. NPDC001552 TaxID=3364587 RepID=UPI003680755C
MSADGAIRRLRDAAVENGGSVHRTVRWLIAEAGRSGGDPQAGAWELIGMMWEAFDITLGQAQLVSAWTGANCGGSLSEARLERELGRLVPRGEDLDIGALDRGREAYLQPRRMALVGDHRDLPSHFRREFRVHGYTSGGGLLVLRSGGAQDAGGLLDIEFQHVQGMRLAPGYGELFITDSFAGLDAAGADMVAELDVLFPAHPTHPFKRLVLSDGERWGFVVCSSVRAYRFDPPAESGRRRGSCGATTTQR